MAFKILGRARALRRRRWTRRPFDLRKAMFILPNLFTVASIFCGFYGAVTAAAANGEREQLYRACVAVLLAAVFDSIDGRVARLTHTQSAFGVQMDSLADVISFGAVPPLIAWFWGLSTYGNLGLFACFVFCACGAIRLARFNVMAAESTGPSAFFVGLPIPAAAWILVALIIAHQAAGAAPLTGAEAWPLVSLLILALLMVSTIPFRTFKAQRLRRTTLLALVAVAGATIGVGVLVHPSMAVVAMMLAYLAFGLGEWIVGLARRAWADSNPLDAAESNESADPPKKGTT
ncbi:MAG: CDP-diacylglycerol--serine O-phosphatidyltransferase [Myxococcales bacterium]|nr:CDP-diacylglycerol--serine O-phosphatidyltransferase [Myxococcales bacterium]